MIEAIREIGKNVLKGRSIKVANLILDNLPSEIKGRKQHLIIINYKLLDKVIDIDFEEIQDNTSEKYLWVGNADTGNSPQIYFTTNNLSYLLSQTIPNLIEKTVENSPLGELLCSLKKEMFIDLEFSGRDRYIVNWGKVRVMGEEINIDDNLKKEYGEYKERSETIEKEQGEAKKKEKEKEKTKKGKDISKKLLQVIESKISQIIKSKKQLTKKEINLYTLKINGRLMVEDKEYQKSVIREKIDSLFEENKRRNCSCCNENKPVTGSPKFAKAKSAIGCYITDKVGFSSELSGGFLKNFILCKDCYEQLLVGEVMVRNKFRSYIGGLNVYIIPKFLFPVEIDSNKLSKWAEYINGSFNSVKAIKELEEFEEKLKDYKEFEDSKNNYIINLLFWKKGTGAETKVLRLIKDVPPTRLDLLKRTTNEIKDIGDRLLDQSNQWGIDLQNIYYLIPLRKRQQGVEYRKILSLYDAIFSGEPVAYSFLLGQFIELAQVYKFDKFANYNIGKSQNSDIGLVYAILKANLFLLYLQRLNLLKIGGEGMDYDSLQLEDGMRVFIKEMKYDEPKTALFLLGYLIGEIGNAQYNKGTSKSKPILGKITFQGMNKSKLIRLINEVFEKLIEYKKLNFNEKIFAECKRLLDQNINSWSLQDQENVFYVLSGYAYATHKALTTTSQNALKDETKEEVKENG